MVGITAPWNYPVSLALIPLATAVAAGNRVMLKPSEFTPQTHIVLQSLLPDCFEETEMAVVTGDAETGAAFSALPFDHLLFIGTHDRGTPGHACRRRASGPAASGTGRQEPGGGRPRACELPDSGQ